MMTRRPLPKKDVDTGEYLPNGATHKLKLRAAIYDAGWGRFLDILQQIATKLGKHTLGVDPRYTSQECSACRKVVRKSLSTRTHRCPHCSYVTDRDLNAALNILRLGLESLGITLEAPSIALCV